MNSELSLFDLFRTELETQVQSIDANLLALEQTPGRRDLTDALMRAGHSIKGAARIVQLDPLVHLAHALEDAFSHQPPPSDLDPLFATADLFRTFAQVSESGAAAWLAENAAVIAELTARLRAAGAATPVGAAVASATAPAQAPEHPAPDGAGAAPPGDAALRVTAAKLTRLLELGGQVMLDSEQMDAFTGGMAALKNRFGELLDTWNLWERALADGRIPENLGEMRRMMNDYRIAFRRTADDYGRATRRLARVSAKLYNELVAIRMRPFADGVQGFPRMVRDLAKSLGKDVEFRVTGAMTEVDRDILTQLEAPLTHLIRNAVDHGIESPTEREATGKPTRGLIELVAWHKSGRLHIEVRDDGSGIDIERLRARVISRGLAAEATAAAMSRQELLEFLFLPGFSTAERVSEISGRGVGLDVVRTMVQGVGGQLRLETGQGTVFHLELPLTLSVVRMLLFVAGGETWALPLARVERVLRRPQTDEPLLWNDEPVPVHDACALLGIQSHACEGTDSLVLLRRGDGLTALRVERLLGERELVVRPLEASLAAFSPLAAYSFLDDNTVVLILDAETLFDVPAQLQPVDVLVTDDSPTVRAMLVRLLEGVGLSTAEAGDGQEALARLRAAGCRLLVTDLDMPRMDGLELVRSLRADATLKDLPIIMVSYRESAEDRMAAVTAGVAYYLDKGGFAPEMFLLAVNDLLGGGA